MEIRAGEVVLLAGRSGSGKSSLMHVINGCYPNEDAAVDCSRLEVAGHDMRGKSLLERTAYVRSIFQNARLSFAMTTPYEEMIFCLENFCFSADQMEERAAEQAERYGITPLLHREFSVLSGGELQRVAFACADLVDAPLYLLDEPFANIDEAGIPCFMEQIKRWAGQGKAICIIDHRLEFWNQADRWYLLDEGGKLQEVELPLTDAGVRSLTENGLLGEMPPLLGHPCRESVMRLQDVSIFCPDGTPLVRNVSFDLHAGEMVALVGRSGAGKTSFFKALLKQFPSCGSIEIMGQSLAEMKKRELYSWVGLVFQDPSLQFMAAKVIEELALSFPDCFASALNELLDTFHFEAIRHVSPWLISQGQQRRLAFLTMMGLEKRILFVDEPTYGQDFQHALSIMTALEHLCRKGLACIFTSHDHRFVRSFAHRVLRIHEGKMEEVRHA